MTPHSTDEEMHTMDCVSGSVLCLKFTNATKRCEVWLPKILQIAQGRQGLKVIGAISDRAASFRAATCNRIHRNAVSKQGVAEMVAMRKQSTSAATHINQCGLRLPSAISSTLLPRNAHRVRQWYAWFAGQICAAYRRVAAA